MNHRQNARRRLRHRIGAMLATLLLALMASPASAAEVIKQTGSTGPYVVTDTSGAPGARCGYKDVPASSEAFLQWIRVKPPTVYRAGTGTAPQRVSWQVRLQRKRPPESTWVTVASTPNQDRHATDTTPAPFSALKVFYDAAHTSHQYRAVAVIKWYHGVTVSGTLQLRIQYYGVKWNVGNPDFVYTDACTAWAD